MASANTRQANQLYLEENMNSIKCLPAELARTGKSYQMLNDRFESEFKVAHSACMNFEMQTSAASRTSARTALAPTQWTFDDDLRLQQLSEMRKCEEAMMVFQDEKIALLGANIECLEAYISKMTRDLN